MVAESGEDIPSLRSGGGEGGSDEREVVGARPPTPQGAMIAPDKPPRPTPELISEAGVTSPSIRTGDAPRRNRIAS